MTWTNVWPAVRVTGCHPARTGASAPEIECLRPGPDDDPAVGRDDRLARADVLGVQAVLLRVPVVERPEAHPEDDDVRRGDDPSVGRVDLRVRRAVDVAAVGVRGRVVSVGDRLVRVGDRERRPDRPRVRGAPGPNVQAGWIGPSLAPTALTSWRRCSASE